MRRRSAAAAAITVACVAAGLPASGVASAGPPKQPAVDRYALAGGCWVLRSSRGYVVRAGSGFAANGKTATAAEPFRFQAFDLGKYLLYGARSDFLTAAGPATTAAPRPSSRAEWVVRSTDKGIRLTLPVDDGSEADPGPVDPAVAGTLAADAAGRLAVVPGDQSGKAMDFAVERATGCATYPDIATGVTGTPASGETPYGETQGYLDAHLHLMAFEFLGGRARCGRPWHPYGPASALVDCPDHEPNGNGAALEQLVSGGTPGEGHDTTGWPEFGYWPNYKSLTHEQVYWRWLQRAHQGGLRMATALLVENGQLCEIYPLKKNSCNEMDSVRLQAQRLHELVRYVDAQAGGPGKGFLQVVRDPFEARRAINAGKLALVMGMEVSVPLNCGETLGLAKCTAEQVRQRMAEVHALGVRQMEMTNKFDNALTGVTGDTGNTGLAVNGGNFKETGHFWKMGACTEPEDHATHRHDKTQPNAFDSAPEQPYAEDRDGLLGGVAAMFGGFGAAPVYGPAPHCNAQGLSDLGRTFLDSIRSQGMVFDPDHMSAVARQAALEHLEAAGYSGVTSSHSWSDDANYRKILEMGGVVTAHAGNSTTFVESWRELRRWADQRFAFGVGFGSDVNGFSTQGAPRNPSEADDVDYPFTGLGGVQVAQQTSGQQTWDVNTDGVDHYGLYPDWVEDAQRVAGSDAPTFAADMARGPEVYLQMWERAVGIAPDACRADVPDADVSGVAAGMTPEQVLRTAGQPRSRTGDVFSYCATTGTVQVRFGPDGRVLDVTPA